MKFQQLFCFCVIFCDVSGHDYGCTNIEKDVLRNGNAKLYIMHSFSRISNHSFESTKIFKLPLTYPSKHLVKIMELSDISNYAARIHSIKSDIYFEFRAMRVDVMNGTKDYCGYKQTVTYFVLVIKTERLEKERNSIILHGCDVLTSGYVTVSIIESDTFILKPEEFEVLLKQHRISMFSLSDYVNDGFCMCSQSPQYVTDCLGNKESSQRRFSIHLFWIVIAIIVLFIIVLCFCF